MAPFLAGAEMRYIMAHLERCPGCGHLELFHREYECDGMSEPIECMIDGCDCLDHMNARQRQEQSAGLRAFQEQRNREIRQLVILMPEMIICNAHPLCDTISIPHLDGGMTVYKRTDKVDPDGRPVFE